MADLPACLETTHVRPHQSSRCLSQKIMTFLRRLAINMCWAAVVFFNGVPHAYLLGDRRPVAFARRSHPGNTAWLVII
jgi:hypothetical protein